VLFDVTEPYLALLALFIAIQILVRL